MAQSPRKKARSGSIPILASAVLGALAIGWLALSSPSDPPSAAAAPLPAPTPASMPAATAPASIQTITGTATVIDADTLDIHAQRIRLEGVDAPESGQKCRDAEGALVRCGTIAANALDMFINRNPVTCATVGKDRYQRILADCSVRGESLQDWLVRNGHAVAYRQYSTAYVEAERAAREARAGMWAGEFVMPWDWRKGQRLRGEPPTKAMQRAASGAE